MTAVMDQPIRRPRWRSGPVAWAVGGLVVLVLLATAFLASRQVQSTLRVRASAVSIETVRRDIFHDFIPLDGKLQPRDVIYLDALEGGQVETVLVRAGDQVVAGQPLLAFRNTTLELEVLDREGRLIESITQLQTYEKSLEQNRAENEKALARIQYDILRLERTVQRRDALAAKGYLSLDQRDQGRDELAYNRRLLPLQIETNRKQEALRQGQAPRIRAELASLQQSLGITRGKLDALVVKAPAAGRVTTIDLKVGQNRNRGERLAELTPDTGFKVSADIDEYYLGRLRTGRRAVVDLEGKPLPLVVSRIYPQVAGGRFTVDFDFQGVAPRGLNPGQAVTGRLALGEDRPALILANGAFLERSGGAWAFVLAPGGGQAERRPIRIGRRNAEQVEILAGVKPGERVITSDYAGLEKIDRITLTN